MKNSYSYTCAIFAILTIQLILVSDVYASNDVGAAVFCPNNFDPSVDTANEISLARTTCTYIKNMLSAKYGYVYFATDSSCTVNYYLATLQSIQTIYDQAVVFSKGHRGVPFLYYNPPNTNHFSLLDYYGSNVIDDTIYGRTSSENVFTFIWHCQTAQHYQYGVIPHDNYGYYGMPYCWTHNAYMYAWGTSGSQVFLGWVDGSPQFETPAEGSYNYAHVAYLFWYHVCNGAQVDEALDNIAQTVFGDASYLQCAQLKDKLVVYGNRDLTLPAEW